MSSSHASAMAQPGGSDESRFPARANVKLEAIAIDKSFGGGAERVDALQSVSLRVRSGEFVSIVGPSGCGKSTLLNILAGLDRPDAGHVELDGAAVTGTIGVLGYMPQRDLLMPWRTVLDNTILPLELRHISRKEARTMALAHFERFGLTGFEHRYPSALSGGMRQRAALLRTFLTDRAVLLLDEPLGALDAITRAEMQAWLLEIWGDFSRTIVLVTHDVDEALYLSDRVYVMTPRPGKMRAEIAVTIPRPRAYDEVVTSVQFAALKRRVLAALHGRGT